MEAIHVIVAIGCGLARDALRRELENCGDIEVVAEVSSPVEILCRAELEHADAIILDLDEDAHMPGVLTHVFAEFPQMLAIAIDYSHNRYFVYRQQITEEVHDDMTAADLQTTLRTALTDYWTPISP